MFRQQGFTLVELVVVIIITGILSIGAMQLILAPVELYADQARRARLVEAAQLAGDRIVRDVRQALPNSVRVGCAGGCLEMMRAFSGGRYRALPPGDTLSFLPGDADSTFEALGVVPNAASLATSNDDQACSDGTSACVVVYNTGFEGTDAWAGDNAATLSDISGSPPLVSFVNSSFSSGNSFPAASPGQRFFLVDSAISYLCDSDARTLRRYQGYSHRADQQDVDTHDELMNLDNPAETALLATDVSACAFEYSAGTPTRNALLTVSLSMSEGNETVTLLQQVHVENTP